MSKSLEDFVRDLRLAMPNCDFKLLNGNILVKEKPAPKRPDPDLDIWVLLKRDGVGVRSVAFTAPSQESPDIAAIEHETWTRFKPAVTPATPVEIFEATKTLFTPRDAPSVPDTNVWVRYASRVWHLAERFHGIKS